jgi:trigger factor
VEDCNRPVKVTLERLPESRVQLDIEVDENRLERSIDAAYKKLAGKARIPGFRPGKAPRHVVERLIGGRPGLIREALDTLVPDAYNDAIAEQDVDAIDQPELEIIETDPVRFKAIVPIRPTVELGDYRAIRVEQTEVTVSEEALAEQILMLRRRHSVQAPVERPAQYNDVLTATVVGTVEDDPFVRDEDAEFALREGNVLLLPGLTEAFIGMSKGEEKVVDIPIPDDFRVERLQGKTANFTITLSEVKEEQLPDVDDELAQQVNADEFPDWGSLVERISADLLKSLQGQADAKLQQEAIDKLVECATLEYPQVLIEREITHLVSEATGGDQNNYRAYLAQVGRSEAEFRETFREASEARLRRSLVLAHFGEAEAIEVTSDEIIQEIGNLAAPMGDESQRFVEMFRSPEGIETIRRNLLSRKTLERVQAIARGEAGEAPVAEVSSAPESVEEPA